MKVLIVVSDTNFREYLSRELKDAGVEVSCVSSIEEAESLFGPSDDGIEACILGNNPDTVSFVKGRFDGQHGNQLTKDSWMIGSIMNFLGVPQPVAI